ncbi:MAG: nucleotidyltransferase domain-containing protein [Actinomycetota bacterium]|nr:nucleotidyltransferase domain-containing protein [Actinomycetota bacterium]
MSDAVFHRLDRDLVVRRLGQHATGALAARPEVREVVLIGSLARGDWSARSDADLVVVVDRVRGPGRDRAPHYVPDHVGVPVDVFVYSCDEAADWSPRFRSEVSRGLVLYRRTASANAADAGSPVRPGHG